LQREEKKFESNKKLNNLQSDKKFKNDMTIKILKDPNENILK
jgi:hypothetical protein